MPKKQGRRKAPLLLISSRSRVTLLRLAAFPSFRPGIGSL